MNALWNWLNDRTGLGTALAACREVRCGGPACLCRSLPCVLLFAFLVQAITGVFMLMRYCPSSQTAWESVYWLQYEIQGGWLLRAVHHCCGQTVLVLVGLYLVGMIVRGTYRAPREFVYWSVVLLGLVTLAMLLTGDLLAWDENSRSATLTRVGFLQALPGVGESLFKLAAGGAEFGNFTLSQFTTLHTIVFAGAFFALLVLRWWFARRAGSPSSAENAEGSPYWPGQVLVNVLGCLILLAVVFGWALAQGTCDDDRGIALGAPADPTEFYDAARPEWAFMGLYGFAKLDVFAGGTVAPVFIVPGSLVLLFLLMPFIGRCKLGHVFNVVLVLGLLAGNGWLSYHVLAQDRADKRHVALSRQGELAGRRMPELIRRNGGIPPAGPLALLHDDPKVQGRKLFIQHCATCHDYVGGARDDVPSTEPTAPNLFGFGSRRWIAGLLNPEQVAGPDYFGNTAFRRGQMVDFVKETFVDMADEDREEREQIIMALSAEGRLPAQREIDRKYAKQIAEGRVSIGGTDEEPGLCTDCHRFGKQGRLGTAPDLTGYGSREWLIGIIRNPADRRFYGKKNDRMQAYGETNDQAKNLLTDREIELLADWLRGDWYEPAGSGQ